MSFRQLSALLFAAFAALVTGLAGGTAPVRAQNMFAPVAKVNDKVVTLFEWEQRMLFYEALRTPGDLESFALEALVDERLQIEAADRLGVTVNEEQLVAGMEEFSARAELTTEQMIEELGTRGVAPETFKDFILAGLYWREVVGSRFGPRAEITEAEIDRAMALSSSRGGLRVLLSEIVLPANTPLNRQRAEVRANELAQITSFDDFATAARRFSASPSGPEGGRMDWMPVGNLPPQIAGQVLTLSPGEVAGPIPLPEALVLFQLRGLQETAAPTPKTLAVEFMRYFIPGGRTERALSDAARVAAEVDTCDDLYGVLRNTSENVLRRDTLPVTEISGDIALELAQLDPGEISTNLTTADGQTLVFLMLCGRTMEIEEEISRADLREQLRGQRMESYAAGYLSELRADAVIVYP